MTIQNTNSINKKFIDNTLAVCEYPGAIATVEISALEIPPLARRFEVYGTEGSAIMEPFEPVKNIRLSLKRSKENYKKGVSYINVNNTPRYVNTFNSFVQNIKGKTKPLRNYEHELIVQETLLRATGKIN